MKGSVLYIMKKTSRKVVIVGTGFVGTSIAYAMINQGISNELVLIDVNQEKAEGEALDLLDGMAWGEENVAVWSGDYSECSDADLVVITAGVNQKPGQTRLDLVKTNSVIMRDIVKQIMGSGFDGVLVVAYFDLYRLERIRITNFTCYWYWNYARYYSFQKRNRIEIKNRSTKCPWVYLR